MKKISILVSLLAVCSLATNVSYADTPSSVLTDHIADQNKSISGKVVDSDGVPVIGATVIINGTSTGAITDAEGNYSLPKVSEGDVVNVAYLGYATNSFSVTSSQSVYNVTLAPDALAVDEVVVTAMGIERRAKSLTYATQTISNDEFTVAKDVNVVNSLQGKTAGLVITPNSTGAGGSSKIIMRGNKSVGNNQPLIVVDGIPMNNPSTSQVTGEYAGRDGGDALSNINPDDIQSINLLKGASAAALYGSMAANGVLMVTTKRGATGAVKISYASNINFETELVGPKIQKNYGAAKNPDGSLSQLSWGGKINGDGLGVNRVEDFYKTGNTYINSIAISGGTEKVQSYLSYANTFSKGRVPTNQFNRHNITLRETFNLYDGKLIIDGSMNYIKQSIKNKQGGGTYFNGLNGVYTMPNNANFQDYKDRYEYFDPLTQRYKQNWYTDVNQDFSANPYWVLNRNAIQDNRDRILASGRVTYNITDWIDVQGRLSYERTNDKYGRTFYDGTSTVLVPKNGRFQETNDIFNQFYGDLMVNFHKNVGKWELKASLGTSFMDQSSTNNNIDSDKKGLIFSNIFLPQNIGGSGSASSRSYSSRRLNSVFATVQVGFNEFIYLDLTGRNDWSSTLAFTENNSYFYPSAGLSFLINEVADLGKVNLLKIRGSYTVVGNDVAPYITHPMNTISDGKIELNKVAPFTELKPEKMHSVEVGFDFAAFNNALTADFTYYKTNNKNQLFTINAPSGTGYENYQINAGNIQNSGVEFTVAYRYLINKDWTWRTGLNFSYNKNKILSLDDRLPSRVQLGGAPGYQFVLEEGGSFGDIYAFKMKRDENGVIEVTDTGAPRKTEFEKVGNVNGDWRLGWNNQFQWKNVGLSFIIDGMVGGKTISMTEAYMDKYGTSERSGKARDNGGVDRGNGEKINTETYYNTVGGREGITGEYVYNATNFRLRELTLGYTFRNLFGNYTSLSVDFVARNLFFIYKDSPKDPDMSMSTSNGFQGIDIFSLPSTRNFGLKVQFNF